ncbi:MAG: MBL fold metallo-hydrolase [Egibacteraceae bacterium]
MRLVVLGSSGTHIARDRACASYLVEAGGYRLLMDCGNGSLSRLQRRWDVADIDAVLITHLHVDHFADLYSLYYALRYYQGGPRWVPVYAPRGAHDFIAQLLGPDPTGKLADTCHFEVAQAGDELRLGPLRVELFAAAHPVETLAPRVEHPDGVIAYSADSGPSPQIVACAREADLFLCDSSWLERQRPLPPDLHMTGREAGLTAAQAGVAHLVVTHVFPANDPIAVASEAASVFAGEVSAATDLQEFTL